VRLSPDQIVTTFRSTATVLAGFSGVMFFDCKFIPAVVSIILSLVLGLAGEFALDTRNRHYGEDSLID
jgi:hypothetical protein